MKREIPTLRLHSTLRTAAVLLFAVATCLPATTVTNAQQPPHPATSGEENARVTPSFLLETIEVEGARPASSPIVLAEARLRPGTSYSEDDLRQAVYRVRRLPFVVDARFRLAKGSERQSYTLVITVEEATAFFFSADRRFSWFGNGVRLDDGVQRTRDSDHLAATGGVRLFTGHHGVAYLAVSGIGLNVRNDDSGLSVGVGVDTQIGYTHYDVFGLGIVASAAFARNDLCCIDRVFPLGLDPVFSRWRLEDAERFSLDLAIPLGGRESLTFALSDLEASGARRFEVLPTENAVPLSFSQGPVREQRAEARWVRDTSDDPLTPTRGSVVSAGLLAVELTSLQEAGVGLGAIGSGQALPRLDTRLIAIVAEAEHFWPILPRHTVGIAGHGFIGRSKLLGVVGRSDVPPNLHLTSWSTGVSGRWAIDLVRAPTHHGGGPLRLELATGVSAEGLASDPGLDLAQVTRFDASVSLVFRPRWGMLRLSLTWLDLRGAR